VTPDEALARLAAARVGHLGTVRPDGSPHVVPFVFALDGRTLYWAVDAKLKRTARIQRLSNIEHEPRVEVVVDGYDEDWSRLWWVRASGRARALDPGNDERRRALDLLAGKYGQYRDDRPAGPVVVIDLDAVSGWSAAGV
jgi:PPOX class probable F420-dependent enzyme